MLDNQLPSAQSATNDAQSKPTLKAVLFDMDDTLFDHAYSSRCGIMAVRDEHALLQQVDEDALERQHMQLIDELHPQFLSGEMTIDQLRLERFQRLFAHYGQSISIETANTAALRYREVYQATRQPIAGVIPLLKQIRPHVKIAVVTNNGLEEQRGKLRHCQMDDLIDVLVTSEEVGVPKPDPLIFQVALERLDCRAEEALMVGDSWPADIIGAQRAGLRAIWFNRRAEPCPDPELALEIKSFEELVELLQFAGESA